VDDARIDEEVQRRLEAERQRLEAERTRRLAGQGQPAQGQPAQTQTASPPATTTQSAVATAEPVPLPVQVDPTPVPTPIPTPVVVQSTPLPTPPPVQVPARAALKPGDLAEPGTDGLVPPQLVKPYKPPYPPMAKAQKVEGVVVVQVLVSETGKVLSVKILRGVAQKVGINEAALEAARRSTFRPGNVGGVPVKSYKNVTVPFRL
jgi:protein TonB